MFDADHWKEVWETISRNKARSFFTGFGIFWGIFMLMVLVGFGGGFEGWITEQIKNVETNSCFFYSGNTGEAYKGFAKGRRWRFSGRDIAIIKNGTPELQHITPLIRQDGNLVVWGGKKGDYTTMGIHPEYYAVESQRCTKGRLLNEVDAKERRKVCVIGTEVYESLFATDEDPLGKHLRVGGIYLTVVGVAAPMNGLNLAGDPRSTVYIPFTTMQQIYGYGDEFTTLVCSAYPGSSVSLLEETIKLTIRELHHISPTDRQAIYSFNLEERIRMITGLFFSISLLTWIIGMGALLSGVIGISTIMLVTVRERTHEIGIRRAIGARPRSVIGQVLSESVLLTMAAGLSGFMLAVAMLEILTAALKNSSDLPPPLISFNIGLTALVIIGGTGLLAGAIPAWQALRIKAIDAIRDE